jgi:HlyD family type I secretion membrane fusion protein
VKLNLRKIFAEPGVPEPQAFGTPIDEPLSAKAQDAIKRPMLAGSVIVGVFVVGFLLWASIAPIWGAVSAPGVVRVEANRQSLKSRDGGVVRSIEVRDGDLVRQGQLLMTLDSTVPTARVDVSTNQVDVARMQQARFLAEATGQRGFATPPELVSRQHDPRVAQIINSERMVFAARLSAIEGQAAILNQRFDQLESARSGLNVQVQSIDEQVALIREELEGYQTLYEKGFAPKTLILRLERQLAELSGRRGALVADITRNQQAAGETRLQLAQLYEQRTSEAATGRRDAEARLADVQPQLDAATEALAQTQVRAPMNGYVLNLSQFTVGGVAAPGELLMDVVPTNAPLVISAQVRPSDIDEVRNGMDAQVTLTAFSGQRVPKLMGEVIFVSADAITPQEGNPYFRVDLRIQPQELSKLPDGSDLTPGMPAQVMIRTGRRTIMSYLLGPISDIFDRSLREQ